MTWWVSALAILLAVFSLPAAHAQQDPYHITGAGGFTLGWPMTTQPTQGMIRIACRDLDSWGVGTVMRSDGYGRDMRDPDTMLPVTLLVCSFQGMVGSIGIMWSPYTFARADDPELAWRDATIAVLKRLLASYDKSLIVQSQVAKDAQVQFAIRDAQGNQISLRATRLAPGAGFRIVIFYFWAPVLSAPR